VSDEEAAKSLAEFLKRAIISGIELGGDGVLGRLAFRWSLPVVVSSVIQVDREEVVGIEERGDEVVMYTRLGTVVRAVVKLSKFSEYSYSVEVQVIEATQPVAALEEV